MNSKNWRIIHKWLAIFIGIFLLAWTISGIIMVLPNEWFDPTPISSSGPINYQEMEISPQAAISHLEDGLGEGSVVVNLNLKRFFGTLYYGFTMQSGDYRLVNASTGEELKITDLFAEELIRKVSQNHTEPIEIQAVNSHDLLYPFGPLPVYRVIFPANRGEIYYVSMINGDIARSTWPTRLRAGITSLHTFEPIKIFTQRNSIQNLLLVGTAALTVVVAITGYVLAVQPILRRRSNSRRSKNKKSEK